MLSVLNVYQLTAVAAGYVGHDKRLHHMVFRIAVIVSASHQAGQPFYCAVAAADVEGDVIEAHSTWWASARRLR